MQYEKELLETLLNSSSDCILAFDCEYHFTLWNFAMEEASGLDKTEVLGKHAFDLFPALKQTGEDEFYQAALQGDTVKAKNRLYISPKTGQKRFFDAHYSPIHNSSGNIIGCFVIARDVTERRQAEIALQRAKINLETRVQERTAELRVANEKLQTEIAERKQAEATLKRIADETMDLYNNAPCGYHSLDKDGVFLQINNTELNWLGYSREEIIDKKRFSDLLTAESLKTFTLNFDHFKQSGWIKDLEFEMIRADGTVLPVLLTASTVKDAAGNFVMSRSTVFDITERKQAEAALQQSERRYRAIVEDQTDMITRYQPDGTITFVNEAYCRYFGVNRKDLIGHRYEPLIYEEDRSYVAQQIGTLSLENSQVLIENRVIVQGQVRWTQWINRALFDEHGRFVEFQAVGRDISDRKQSEIEVSFLQTMTQAIFESDDFHSALGIALQKVGEATGWSFGEAWIPRKDGGVLESSPAWYSSTPNLERFRELSNGLTFAPGAGLPGRVWLSKQPEWRRDVSADSDQIYLRARLAKEVGLKAALGIPIIANDKVLAVLIFYMFESRDEDERLIQLISASTQLGLIIQRKRTEGEIRQALEKEKELNELKSRFVSMTSHEFRTPLSVIAFSAGLLESYSNRWEAEKKARHYGRIQTAVKRMTQLLDDVLFIGKAEAEKLEFKPTPLDLREFCGELVEEMQLGIGREHTLSFVCQKQCPQAYMDEKLLRQILSNLLSNAIKYSPQQSTVLFELALQNNEVTFHITDQGIGIPPEDQQRLFETFHRASNVGTIAGTGLGLAIVKKSVDLQGGHIALTSEVGKGTTFSVTLPLVKMVESI